MRTSGTLAPFVPMTTSSEMYPTGIAQDRISVFNFLTNTMQPIGNDTTTPSTSATPSTCGGNSPSVYIAPLSYRGLEQSIELRSKAMHPPSSLDNPKKRDRDEEHDGNHDDETYHYASYVVYCQGSSSGASTYSNGSSILSSSIDEELHRTGRWNDQEVEYVDQLVTLFDQGLLPIPNGTKLGSFLGDMLLCKSSRLTKKMKNAKLSSRSFTMSTSSNGNNLNNHKEEIVMLSALQEQFILSLPSLSAQLEMRFNLSKQWRSYLSNLCVELEFATLDVADFLSSLEEQETRAAEAESNMRNVRRRRTMG
eukprot:CAMPEP_0178817134 /NCGR_PEP_ID=MMETSP0746-20121128/1725_1 /TAXON_ID=913974 /ORGANISM="Nitzschia punctata, Strain CCMP561" /LENGTH=308 /DNA_ID=CAMNT_0020478209 /DNA_START=1610 /DNA_END=2533 /DNA_ORIENTATION=+